jgi:hypothetical protein
MMQQFEEQRQQALLDNAMRNISFAHRYLSVSRVLFNNNVFIEVETQITVENLRLIQSTLDAIQTANVTIEPELTGCEKLGNLICLALAKNFPDSRINIRIVFNDHIDVVINFNHKQKT